MTNFKDRTFCIASIDSRCANNNCYRFFSDELSNQAERWWGRKDYPLAVSDFYDTCDLKE